MLVRNNNLYLGWLSALVESARPGQSFLLLFQELQRNKFTADIRVPLDNNRVSDALELRQTFFRECRITDEDYVEDRVSVLELLVQLAFDMGRIVSREDNIPSYFFELLENLGICISDSDYIHMDYTNTIVYLAVQKLIRRRYGASGFLFPLKHPKKDQRRVEIWFQMQAYLMEEEEESWTS